MLSQYTEMMVGIKANREKKEEVTKYLVDKVVAFVKSGCCIRIGY